ncbi:unnamed protein product [Symbiodinium sp. KB8]|nr:unnamed protein product [Symbiodinium sp. KB8]
MVFACIVLVLYAVKTLSLGRRGMMKDVQYMMQMPTAPMPTPRPSLVEAEMVIGSAAYLNVLLLLLMQIRMRKCKTHLGRVINFYFRTRSGCFRRSRRLVVLLSRLGTWLATCALRINVGRHRAPSSTCMCPWRGPRGCWMSWILCVLSACCILTCAGEPQLSPWLDTDCDHEDCLTDFPSLCRKAARLIRRVHDVDGGGHHFVEPSEVWNLCLEFLGLQEGPARPGQHIVRCSRAMLAMAVLYDVVSDELDNSTCSTASVHKQFPILDSFEQRIAELRQDRQHKIWWKTAYSKHTQLGSGREFQRKGAKLLRLLANHTERCRVLGHACAVYNAWEPETCFPHDDLVQSWSPSCQDDMQIPSRPQTQPEMTRMLETATSTSTFVVVEAGASVGYWAPKAAKAFRRRFPDTGACHLVLIDSIVPASSAAANLQRNGIYDLCNISFFQSRATASLLDRLIDFFGTVDLLHVDIQEAELDLVQRSVRLPRVQHLFVGTHGRRIHRQVRSFLAYHGFAIDFDYVGKSFLRTPIGPVVFGDGVLAACRAQGEGEHKTHSFALCYCR